MINLTNRENLAVSCFEKSLQELSAFCKDEEQVALDIVENPKFTVHRLRKILESTQSSLNELKSEVLVSIPATNAYNAKQRDLKEASFALRSLLLLPSSKRRKNDNDEEKDDNGDEDQNNNTTTTSPQSSPEKEDPPTNSSRNDGGDDQASLLAQLSAKYQELQRRNQNKNQARKPGELKGFTSVGGVGGGIRHSSNTTPTVPNQQQQHHVSFFTTTTETKPTLLFSPSPPKRKGKGNGAIDDTNYSHSISASFFASSDNAATGGDTNKKKKKNHHKTDEDEWNDWVSSRRQDSSSSSSSSSSSDDDDDLKSNSSLTSLERKQRREDREIKKRKRQQAKRDAAAERRRKIYNDQDSDEEYFFDTATLTFAPKDPAFIRKKLAMYNNSSSPNKKKMKEYKKILEQHHKNSRERNSENQQNSTNNANHIHKSPVHTPETTAVKTSRINKNVIHPTQYLSIGTHFFLELLARQTLAKEIILYRYKPGSPIASVVNVFCTRPQLELYSDVVIAESLVGRVISSGVAVNISPESPTETNFPRLVVPIFSTGRRTVVVGAVLLQHRACGGSFSSSEETNAASWCELAAHLVQPPAVLKGKPKPMTTSSTKIPTSMLPAIDYFLPKKGRIVSNIYAYGNTNDQTNTNNSNTYHQQQNQNKHIDESLVFDSFSTSQSSYRTELWSTIALHDAIELNYKPNFEQLRRERIQQAMINDGKMTATASGLSSSSSSSMLTKSLGSIDRFVNSSFLSSLHDMTISASERIEGETGAHKFLMKLCSKLSSEIENEKNLKNKNNNNSNNNNNNSDNQNTARSSSSRMTKEQEKSLQQIGGAGGAGKALLQLIAASQKHSTNVSSAEALLQTAISEKTSTTRSKSSPFYSTNNNKEDASSSSDAVSAMMFSPDDLADLVDRCEVPILVLRSVFQDVWKKKTTNNNTSETSDNQQTQQQNQRLAWYPAQRSATTVISSASKGSGKHTTATNHTYKNDETSNEQQQNQQQQNQQQHHGTMAQPKTSGISESISSCISTLPVVDVATHVSRLEYSWRNAIEDQRATDLHHLTHLADYSKTKHKLTVVERQRNEALTKSDESSKKYQKLKSQIGMLCSREFMTGVGATNMMSNVLPKISNTNNSSSSEKEPGSPNTTSTNTNTSSPRRSSSRR